MVILSLVFIQNSERWDGVIYIWPHNYPGTELQKRQKLKGMAHPVALIIIHHQLVS